MGCCFSKESGDSEQQTEEVKPLIDPVSNLNRHPNGADYRSTSQTTAVSSRHEYEQSALNQILVKTANNIIDVSATDSHGMEQHEYMDRARLYSARVVMVGSSSHGSAWAKPPSLMTLTTQPFHVLASPLVSHSDITQVARFAAYASNAGAQVKVDHKEELVAHFNIP
ncbi:ragulator complex protein LAMTOR1 isoform X1 [Petromyzon marinus]|uniref:Ragulator complex protein LAMTOR1 n=1 Tax=Petromyzon marinus TaxID=7757 RepID=A0AAJ7UBE8_PETMA|nr:ragulator complex protein LAMTOR1 isoform X1 [Petromyzon marinus]